MPLDTIHVTGTLVDLTGQPRANTPFTLIPSGARYDTATGALISEGQYDVESGDDGTFDVAVIPTDDPSLTPEITLTLVERWRGGRIIDGISVPANSPGGTVALSVLLAAIANPPPPGTVAYTPLNTHNTHAATIASDTVLGHVKVGDGLTVAEDGTLSVTAEGGVSSVNDLDGDVTLDDTNISGQDPSASSAIHTLRAIFANLWTAITARLVAANNLSDLASASLARFNLGLGSAATRDVPSSGVAATSIQVARGDDPRFTDSRIPTGAAGGQVVGAFPDNLLLELTSPNTHKWRLGIGNDGTISRTDIDATPTPVNSATPGQMTLYGHSINMTNPPYDATGWITQFLATDDRFRLSLNGSRSGWTAQQLLDSIDVNLAGGLVPGATNVLVLWAASNSFGQPGESAATILAKVQAMADWGRTHGYHKIFVMTEIKRGDLPNGSPGDTQRQDYNALLLAAEGDWVDKVVDLAGDSEFSTPGSSPNWADNIHLTTTGEGVVAADFAIKANEQWPPANDPPDLADLAFGWRYNNLTLNDGDPIVSIDDQDGDSGASYTQAVSGKRALWHPTGATFDGLDDHYTYTPGVNLGVTPFTVCIVAKRNANLGTFETAAQLKDLAPMLNDGSGKWGSYPVSNSNVTLDTTTPHILTISVADTTHLTFYTDGGSAITRTGSNSNPANSGITVVGSYNGSGYSPGSLPASMDLLALYIWRGAHDSTAVAADCAWLTDVLGL